MREVQVRDQPASASTLLALLGVAVLLPVLVIALLILPVWAALVVSVVAAAVASWIAWSRATTTVRRLSGGSPADPVRHARLLNIVDGLCLAAGVQAPNVDVVEDAAANALVAGRSERDAVIVVTSGLLEALDRVELEGAIAHQLVQLRDPSLGSATVAVTTVGLPVLLADRLGRTGGSGQRRPRPIRLGVGVDRQTWSDLDAVSLTRYPPGLIGAYEDCERVGTVLASASTATAHLWMAPPIATSVRTAGEADRDGEPRERDLAERIDILREL